MESANILKRRDWRKHFEKGYIWMNLLEIKYKFSLIDEETSHEFQKLPITRYTRNTR